MMVWAYQSLAFHPCTVLYTIAIVCLMMWMVSLLAFIHSLMRLFTEKMVGKVQGELLHTAKPAYCAV